MATFKTMSAETEARLNVAQQHGPHDWARMINKYWGRTVARVEKVANYATGAYEEAVVSDQPWRRGYPKSFTAADGKLKPGVRIPQQ